MTEPLVSIGIPTRNRRQYLSMAIESVLNQTYQNVEVIVSDNCSTDDTWEHLSSLSDSRVKILRQERNLGMVGNCNAVLSAASGDYFLLLSDDDILSANCIGKLVHPFLQPTAKAQPQTVGMSWTACTLIDANGNKMWDTDPGPETETAISFLCGLFDGRRGSRFSGIMVRTDDARSVGGYNEARHGVLCDTGNWGRVALHYQNVACSGEKLVQYRVHAASETQISAAADWQGFCENIHEDMVAVLRSKGDRDGESSLRGSMNNHLANITVTVLMRYIGHPGWVGLFAREFWRSRRFMLTPFVAKRIARDGWKLLR